MIFAKQNEESMTIALWRMAKIWIQEFILQCICKNGRRTCNSDPCECLRGRCGNKRTVRCTGGVKGSADPGVLFWKADEGGDV